jgi:hypothetical protein
MLSKPDNSKNVFFQLPQSRPHNLGIPNNRKVVHNSPSVATGLLNCLVSRLEKRKSNDDMTHHRSRRPLLAPINAPILKKGKLALNEREDKGARPHL